MENKSVRILELNKILETMADYTQNELVRTRILSLRPENDMNKASFMQAETTEAAKMLLRRGYPQTLNAPAVVNSLRRCEVGSVLSPRELLDISRLLGIARNTKRYLESADAEEFPVLYSISQSLTPVRQLEEQINMCILSEEEIADGASSELASIRRKMRSLQGKIKDMLDGMIHSAKYQKYLQDPIVTMRSDRYVIPVRSEYRAEVPGIVHDTSSSGATLFIEPMSVVNANNEIRDLIGKEEAEIERILAALTAEAGEYSAEIETNHDQVCELDFIFAKGKLSLKYSCSEPKLNTEGRVFLKKARHPLINGEDVVANDIYLGGDFDTLVITGPNTGGKTVTLKTIGLFCLMAACGLHIPVLDGSEVALFDSVWADIGDEQSIEQSLSTFSSHMSNIVQIVRNAGKNSLVLFDELGAGTDPTEGAALAVAILEYLRLGGVKIAATTHYSELKLFALSTPGVCNASCEFDVKSLRPTYKLLIGVPGKSNAFAISERLGLDCAIIERSRALLKEDDVRFEDVIGGLEADRRKAEAEREQAQKLHAEIAELREQIKNQKETLESNRRKILDEARREAKRIVIGAKEETSKVIKELNALKFKIKTEDVGKAAEEARSKIKKKSDEIDKGLAFQGVKRDSKPPKDVNIGDKVEVLTLGQVAEVISKPDKSGNVAVLAGGLRANVKLKNLRLVKVTEGKKKSAVPDTGSRYTPRKANAKTEIDLRGYTLEEAILEVDRFLDDAYMAGLTQVYIIHGKGTGVLRAGIADFLKRSRHVKSFRLGRYGEGEDGVTVAELN